MIKCWHYVFLRGLILLYKAIALSSQYSIWGAFWENINKTLVGGNQIKYSRIRRFINIERKASWRGWLLVSLFSKIGTDVSLLTSLLAGPMTWGNLQPPLVSGNLPGVLGGQEAKYVWSAYFGVGMCPVHSNRQISSSARKSLDVCKS